MDHHLIEESNMVDRYLLGKLPREDQAQFEEHFIDCQACLDRLETSASFRRGIKAGFAEDVARTSAYVRMGLFEWFIRRARWQQAAFLLILLLFVALPAVFYITKIRRVQTELDQAKKDSSEWQRRYEEQQRAISALEKQLHEAKANANAQHSPRITTDPDKGNELQRPQAGVPVFALNIVRGGGPDSSEPANKISISPAAPSIVLAPELEPAPDVLSYRATISNADKQVIWKAADLKPTSGDTLRLNINSGLMNAGDYQLTLEGLTREGTYVPHGKYSFRVSKTK